MLRLDGVDKTFRVRGCTVPALRDVSMTIPSGQLTSVLGASGSGKTTLLRVIAGFEQADRGRVSLDGRYLVGPGTFVRPERRGIGIVPQDGALFPHLDVAGNVAFGLARTTTDRLSPARRRARSARVEELLALVGLEGYQRRRVDQLSGGQQQRVALARALAPSPGVILLDEPFSAIDAALRGHLGTEVRDLLRSLEITTVLVTHDQEEALSLADQVVVMRDGRVVQTGAPREVYQSPIDAATARFVGDAVVLAGTVVSCDDCEARVDCVLGRLAGLRSPVDATAALGADAADLAPPATATTPALPAGGSCHVIIRPESLRMGESGTAAVVVGTHYYGHDAMTTVRLGAGGDGPVVKVRTSDASPLPRVGAAVRLTVVDPVLVVPVDI
jgi:iron(III) transport system ATP-binding protein